MVPVNIKIKQRSQAFSTFTAFEEYFNFSGRKYRLIDSSSTQGKQCFKVEPFSSKPNIPLNILKVISCATLIIPLIMALCRMIMHRKFSVIVEKEQPKTLPDAHQIKTSGENQPITNHTNRLNPLGSTCPPVNQNAPVSSSAPLTINPTQTAAIPQKENLEPKFIAPDPQDSKELADTIHQFKTGALKAFNQANTQGSVGLDFTLSSAQENILLQADAKKKCAANTWPSGVKVNRGGVNCVIFLDCAPQFVFKPMDSEKAAKEYLEINQQALRVVLEDNLYLIHIPASKIIKVQDKFFIMQEKANLVSGSFRGQKGVYSYCWNDEELNDYSKTLFSQLLKFITKTGFSDVKYDNIPLTFDGKVALIDLDSSSAIVGLTKGNAKDRGGLLNYIPERFLNDFLEMTRALLGPMINSTTEKTFNEIEMRAKKRVKRTQDYALFHQKNAISSSAQGIVSEPALSFKDDRMKSLCDTLIDFINIQLQIEKNNLSLSEGRTIFIENNVKTPLFRSAQVLWENTIELEPSPSRPKVPNYQLVISEILEEMKKAGYIFGYKVSAELHFIKIKV